MLNISESKIVITQTIWKIRTKHTTDLNRCGEVDRLRFHRAENSYINFDLGVTLTVALAVLVLVVVRVFDSPAVTEVLKVEPDLNIPS